MHVAASGARRVRTHAPRTFNLQRVFRVTFLSRPAVAKQRFSKRYRHPDLDVQLTKSRLQGVRCWRCTHAVRGAVACVSWLTPRHIACRRRAAC